MIPTKVLRWIVGLLGGFLVVWAAQCRGEHIGRANTIIDLNDSIAKVSAEQTAGFEKVRAADVALFADSLTKVAAAKLVADSALARANRSAGRITVIGSVPAPHGETVLGGDAQPEPDTTAYVGIQRQGDPRTYTVPKFAVDAAADVRNALTAKTREAEIANGTLTLARLTIMADSNVIRSQAKTIAAREAAENAAKQKAGGGCRVLFVPCLSRTTTLVVGAILGAAAGYEVAKR